MHSKPIDKLMDCQHVRRWNLVGTVVDSNVASHSFNVAVLAMAIRKAMHYKTHFTEQEVCYHALLHDVDESETGDMPTPTKAAIRNAGVEPNALFLTQGQVPAPQDIVRQVVKMADLLENSIFISEYGTGARARVAASEVLGRLRRAIDEAPADLARATMEVWEYVKERKSDTDEERSRIVAEAAMRGRFAA